MPCSRLSQAFSAAKRSSPGSSLASEGLGRVLDARQNGWTMLEDFPDFVDRQPRGGQRRRPALAGQQRVEVRQARGLLAIGAKKFQHRRRGVGRGLGEIDEFLVARQLASEQRIGKDLFQRRDGAARLGLQFVRVDPVDGGELQDELDGDRPLVALDEVEIGRRDAKPLGHGGLGEPTFHAQAADARTGEDFLLRHGEPPGAG